VNVRQSAGPEQWTDGGSPAISLSRGRIVFEQWTEGACGYRMIRCYVAVRQSLRVPTVPNVQERLSGVKGAIADGPTLIDPDAAGTRSL
jgi:hypothetical protein